MAYDANRMIITDPVGVGDVQQALGVSSGDVGRLCTNANVKMMSKFKPTDYLRLIFDPRAETAYAESQWKGEMIQYNGVNVRASCGINIPFGMLPESLFGGVDDYVFISSNQYRSTPSTLFSNLWSKITPTKYRLADFWKYIHKTPSYPISGTKYPISFANLTLQTLTYDPLQHTGTLLAVAEIHFDYDDIAQGEGTYYLGVKNLLDAQNGNPLQYNLKFGFMLMNHPSSLKMHFAVTDAAEVQIDGTYDQTTRMVGHRNIAINGAPLIKPAFADGFQTNEKVYILPYIRRTLNIGGTNYRCYFGLNADAEHITPQEFTIKNSSITVQSVRLTSATMTVTYQVVDSSAYDKTIRFWIGNVNDMTFNFAGYSQSDTSNKFYFLTTDFGVMRNDGNGYMVDQNFATLGLSYDSGVEARYTNVRSDSLNATGLLSGISDAQSLFAYYTKYRYSRELTQARIGIQMVVMESDGNNHMVQRSVSFTGYVNPSTAGSTAQTIQLTGVIN